VSTKCAADLYQYDKPLEIGDFVAVQSGKGYNVGVVSQVFPADLLLSHHSPRDIKWQLILHKLTDDRQSLEEMLSAKITFENDALARCRHYCSTHRIGNFIRPIAAEFQFDRKKLTIYVMKTGDASVCKLVRKLFDSFKIRISILDIESPELARHYAVKYLNLSGINLSLNTVFMDPSIIPYVPPTQQLGKSKAASLHQSLSQYSAESLNRRYGEHEAYSSSTTSAYYPPAPAPTSGYSSEPRYEHQRYSDGNYRVVPPDYGYAPSLATTAPSAATPASATGFPRPGGYHPPASGRYPYDSQANYLPKDIMSRDKEPPLTIHYTLAEHQEFSRYHRGGPGNYSQTLRDYAQPSPPHLAHASGEGLSRKYYRETDDGHTPSALDPRYTKELFPRDHIKPFLSTRHDHYADEFPSAVYGEYRSATTTVTNRNHEIAEKNDPILTLPRGATASGLHLYPYNTATSSPSSSSQPLSPSSPASMNRSSQVTYPIEDEAYLNYLTESRRFCDSEDVVVSTQLNSLVSIKSERYELQLDSIVPSSSNTSILDRQGSPCRSDDNTFPVAYVHANYQNKKNGHSMNMNSGITSSKDEDSLSGGPERTPSSISSGTTTIASPSPSTTSSFTSSAY
jgi:hypothetical protein